MGLIDAIVAGKVAELNELAAKWRAGYPLAKEEFDSVLKQRTESVKSFEVYVERVGAMVANLAIILKQAFAEMVQANNELQKAKAELSAKRGTPEESAAQSKVDRCAAAYADARARHLKVSEEKKKKEDFKRRLDKDLESWKDALDDFKKAGEQRLLELERSHRRMETNVADAIRMVNDGKARGA